MTQLIERFDFDVQGAALLASRKARGNASLLFSSGTEIRLQDLATGEVKTLGGGYESPAGLACSPDGKLLAVADLHPASGGFTLYVASVEQAGRADARALLKGDGAPGQLAFAGERIFYADRTRGAVFAIGLQERKPRTIAARLEAPVGIAVRRDGSEIYVAESGGGRIVSFSGDGKRRVERLGLRSPQYLTFGETPPQRLVIVQAALGLIQSWDLGEATETLAEMPRKERPFAAWQLKDRLVAVTARGIHWYDLLRPRILPVTLTMADTRPFIGSYQRIKVDLGTSGHVFDDLEFRLPDGEAAGQVSYARDDLSGPDEIMLLVGYQPGLHKLEAVDRATVAVVATLEFEISDRWTDPDRSPSHWSVGEIGHFTTGYTWGGGPSTPQNVDVIPQSGTRNICILTVDVDGARYPAGAAFDTIKTRWLNGAVGSTPDPDGVVRSARVYFEEVSQNTFTLAVAGGQVLSISLSTNWTDNFSMMPVPWPGNSFAPTNKAAFAQACISAAAALTDGGGNSLVDFSQVQTLILVVRSAGTGAADNFFWPQAWGGSFTIPGGSANIAVLGMPDDWDTIRDTRTICETLSHEIGHNLGYPDLYTNANTLYSADVQARDITNFDLMSNEGELPHLSIAQKMETGWVRPNWVIPFDFSHSTIPLDQTVTLHAAELGTPPAGRFAAAEIRIADGWNYYFEYRRGQAGQIGDQELATNPGDTGNGVVLGTDVITQSFTFPIARPQVMRLRPDVDGENSFFTAGQDYEETDNSSMAVADFRLDVISTNADNAQIRVRYGTNGRPDLSIRPWPGGDNWQSPDIEVRNARSMADPGQWANVPWVGHANTVIARYRNRGPVTARNVRVDFSIKDFTVGGAPEAPLGSDVHDVPPDSSTAFVEFTASWVPADDGHKCVIVRTPLYIDASVNPNIVELTDTNNSAQSNYSRYIAASASPARRGIMDVTLHNPFDKKAEIYVIPQIRGGFASLHRLYMEHSALRLDPGESRKVQVMVESRYGDPRLGAEWKRLQEKIFRTQTRMTLVGYGIPPDAPAHPVLLGGAQINVSSAQGTRFTQFGWEKQEGYLRGRVVTEGGEGARGHVLVTFRADRETEANTIKLALDSKGFFLLRDALAPVQKFDAKRITAHYPGYPGYSPCDAPNELSV